MTQDTKLKIEYVETSKLVPYANNAKIHTGGQVDQICASIEEFRFNDPIAVWGNEDGGLEIIEGHGRLLAAKRIGMTEVPVIRLDHLTDEQRREYTHIHNQLTMNTDFDFDVLEGEIEAFPDFDWESFGFDMESMFDMEPEHDIEEDEVPENAESVVRNGDIWILGDHRLMCGDSTCLDDVAALSGGVLADLFLTDPPYNVAYEGATAEKLTIQNDDMEDEEFRQFLRDAYSAADAFMKPGAAFYIWHADSERYNFHGAALDIGWTVRECLIWAKNSMVLGRQDYQWRHEPCIYGWKGGAAHNWYGDRKQTTVLEFDRPTANREHPTMKPVALFAYLIKNSSKRGDTVLDLFGGSGTTIIACEQLERKAIVMELDEGYCDRIIKRWENLTGKKAVMERNVRDGQQ